MQELQKQVIAKTIYFTQPSKQNFYFFDTP